jgi:hypothetical protein
MLLLLLLLHRLSVGKHLLLHAPHHTHKSLENLSHYYTANINILLQLARDFCCCCYCSTKSYFNAMQSRRRIPHCWLKNEQILRYVTFVFGEDKERVRERKISSLGALADCITLSANIFLVILDLSPATFKAVSVCVCEGRKEVEHKKRRNFIKTFQFSGTCQLTANDE